MVAASGGVAALAMLSLAPRVAAGAVSPLSFSGGTPGVARGFDHGPGLGEAPLVTTTVPTTIPTTVPTPVPTTTVPVTPRPAKPPAPAAPTPVADTTRGILPPHNPAANIPPSPNFLASCSGSAYDDSAGCVDAATAAIDNGRAQEGLPALTLPSNWTALSPTQQLFVATNLERTVRGLAPLSAMATSLDQSAQQAAQDNRDPSPAAGFPYSEWGGNWGGALGNPLEVVYLWMYDDGEGSANVDCTASTSSGCWGHRDNVLMIMSCAPCVMGAGFAPTAYQGAPSISELLVNTSGNPPADFTWQQEEPFL